MPFCLVALLTMFPKILAAEELDEEFICGKDALGSACNAPTEFDGSKGLKEPATSGELLVDEIPLPVEGVLKVNGELELPPNPPKPPNCGFFERFIRKSI